MRYTLFFAWCLMVIPVWADPGKDTRDSLTYLLSITANPQEHLRIYRNLADVSFVTPEETGYLRTLAEKARSAGQTEMELEALTDLVMDFAIDSQLDSARHYLREIERVAPSGVKDQWTSYPTMFLFNTELQQGDPDKIIQGKLEEYKAKNNNGKSIYKQVEDAYILGLYFLNQEKISEAIPYLVSAEELSRKLPFKEGCRYQILVMRRLSRCYAQAGEGKKAIELLEEVIRMQERYFDQYYKESRPFYPMNDFYITNYTTLLLNVDHMPKKQVDYYLGRLTDLCRDSDNPEYKYSYFLTMSNYYVVQSEWEKSLVCNDSLLKYARALAPYNVPGLYRVMSELYGKMGKPQEALEYLKESYKLKDSINAATSKEKIDQLQVEYGMDRLNYEKSQLEVRNKRIMVWGLLVVLLVVGGLCVYLYALLRRERVMKRKLARFKELAEEGEKMKTAFINSMCHEIRTPLNAIVGFSELLFDPSLDQESKDAFPKEIHKSADELTSLVDGMLEVANLDVSDEKLPCERVDLGDVCHKAMEYLCRKARPGIECREEISAGPLEITTNSRYLLLLLEHLLDNAAKFTEKGSIVLQCGRETGDGKDGVVVRVTDTGCGIPAEMRETVFQRFTKLDSYKQGSGLGLYLCRLIAKRLGGKVYIDPDCDSGTSLVVELPGE